MPSEYLVRPLVIVASDVDAPEDHVYISRIDAALATVSQWFTVQAGGNTFRYRPAAVVRSQLASADFQNGGDGRQSDGWRNISLPLKEMECGICLPQTVLLVWVASSTEGGFAGGASCDTRARASSQPFTGSASPAGVASIGQWNLDSVLTGGISASCRRESRWDPGVCQLNHQLGTIAHELGHAFGLNHSCEGDNKALWRIDSRTCRTLIMQNEGAFPGGGFSQEELKILAASPYLKPAEAVSDSNLARRAQ